MATNTANDLATAARGDAASGPDPAPDAASAVIDASVLTAQLAFLAPGNSARFPWSRFPWGGPGGGRTVRASTSSTGGQSNDDSRYPALSANGRFVAFESDAANLAPNDSNRASDIFVKDLRTGRLTLASADAAGNGGNEESRLPSISADGRFVAFDSAASNLAPGDANGFYDVFVKDLRTGQVTLASSDAQGNEGNSTSVSPAISGNGRFVAFASDATNLLPGGTESRQVFVKDLRTGRLTLASADAGGQAGKGDSIYASLSPGGRYVSFNSEASNLVPGDTNNAEDVFRKDLWTGGIDRLTSDAPADSPHGLGSERSSVTDTGAVAFNSAAGNLVPNDTNNAHDIFLST